MNFFKSLFGGNSQTAEERREAEARRQFDALKYDGVRALKSGQWAAAIQCLTGALEVQDDLECHEYLSRAYIHAGQLREAYDELLTLSEAEPDNVQLLLQMASVCYMMEDYQSMAEACEKSLLADRDNPLAYYFYAQACHAQDDDSNALAMLSKAIQLKDDYATAYLLRADIHRLNGELDEAREDVDWLLSHDGAESEDVLLVAAQTYLAQDLKPQALGLYDRTLELNPFSLEALSERASLRRELGDEQGAREDEAQAEELRQRDAS